MLKVVMQNYGEFVNVTLLVATYQSTSDASYVPNDIALYSYIRHHLSQYPSLELQTLCTAINSRLFTQDYWRRKTSIAENVGQAYLCFQKEK
jgi:hypothetical protein